MYIIQFNSLKEYYEPTLFQIGENQDAAHCTQKLLCVLGRSSDSPGKNTDQATMPSSRGLSRPRDRTQVCRHLLQCRQILYPLSHLGNPHRSLTWGFFRQTPSLVNWSLLRSRFYLRPTIPQLFTKALGVLQQIHRNNSGFLKISREIAYSTRWTLHLQAGGVHSFQIRSYRIPTNDIVSLQSVGFQWLLR